MMLLHYHQAVQKSEFEFEDNKKYSMMKKECHEDLYIHDFKWNLNFLWFQFNLQGREKFDIEEVRIKICNYSLIQHYFIQLIRNFKDNRQ